jgi:hypothetical protein
MGGGAPNSLYHDSTGWREQDFVTLLSQVAPASISMNDMADGLLGTACLGQLALTAMDGTVTLSTKWFSAAELRRT